MWDILYGVFSLLFSHIALNGTEYDDSEDIKVTTIDDVIYINMKNDDLLEKCKPLAGYMKLINTIRENEANGMDIKQAIDKVVQKG